MDVHVHARLVGNKQWVSVCSSAAEEVEAIERLDIMSSEARFRFDSGEYDSSEVVRALQGVLRGAGPDGEDVLASGGTFACPDITGHTKTKEVRALNPFE
jgi:hypothetical protein